MSRLSSMTMIAPEPDMVPIFISVSKSYGTSSRSISSSPILNFSPARNTLEEEPPGMIACSWLPLRKPPPKLGSLISSPSVTLPVSISK